MQNRITQMLGVQYPIVQAPMGWIARAPLASAVSNAGGMGIIETSSGALDEVRAEITKMRTLTDKPFGVNIAQAFVRDPGIVDFVVDQGIKFVTTSAGDPNRYCGPLKEAGLTVFHVVPTLDGALKAIAAGVDGLVVEGGEGGGFKNPRDVALMVLLPLILMVLGLTWFFAALGVYLKDLGQFVGFLVTVSLFLSPVFYDASVLPSSYQAYLNWNPITLPVMEIRDVMLFGKPMDWMPWSISLVLGVLIFYAGYAWFQRVRRGFADVL